MATTQRKNNGRHAAKEQKAREYAARTGGVPQSGLLDTSVALPSTIDENDNALQTRLRSMVGHFSLDAAAVMQYDESKEQWRPLLHAYQVDMSVSAAAFRHVARRRTFWGILKLGLAGRLEGDVLSEPELPITRMRKILPIRNLGILPVPDETCVAVLLNRSAEPADQQVNTWSVVSLESAFDRLRDVFTVKPSAPQINLEAYHTDLPGLLQKHVGKWVAYHNGRKHGPFESEFKALEACAEGDVPRNERLIRLIEPEPIGGHHVRRNSESNPL